ncbi:MAG TPA: hypothetical protein VG055_08800 [Planctomycetaceae bacterium]|jgi:hypothetical protein|nr:hypothetical protein [Planctomycetaceae bacterium]
MRVKMISRAIVRAAILTPLLTRSVFAYQGDVTIPETYADLISREDAVCLVRSISSDPPDEPQLYPRVHFGVVDVFKGSPNLVKKGDHLTVRSHCAGRGGGLFLLIGSKIGTECQWHDPTEITRSGFNYLAHAPAFGGPVRKRLPYLLGFVDSADAFIMDDVESECRQATLEDLIAVAPQMPRQKLRDRVRDPKTERIFRAMCGFLLGLCGNEDDARLLAAIIRERDHSPAIPCDVAEIIVGYLMLTGEAGLKCVDEWKLKDQSASGFETSAVRMALCFFWDNKKGFKKQRLVQSMLLLAENHPDSIWTTIAQLELWQNWESLDQIVAFYGQGAPDDVEATKISVYEFLRACINAKRTEVLPEQVAAAHRHSAILRMKDPQFFRRYEHPFSMTPFGVMLAPIPLPDPAPRP